MKNFNKTKRKKLKSELRKAFELYQNALKDRVRVLGTKEEFEVKILEKNIAILEERERTATEQALKATDRAEGLENALHAIIRRCGGSVVYGENMEWIKKQAMEATLLFGEQPGRRKHVQSAIEAYKGNESQFRYMDSQKKETPENKLKEAL